MARCRNLTSDRRAVHMHVEYIHEYGNAPPVTGRKIKVFRQAGFAGRQNPAICGRDNEIVRYRRRSDRIAEEIDTPQAQEHPGKGKRGTRNIVIRMLLTTKMKMKGQPAG